jgi:hypothetical protein
MVKIPQGFRDQRIVATLSQTLIADMGMLTANLASTAGRCRRNARCRRSKGESLGAASAVSSALFSTSLHW